MFCDGGFFSHLQLSLIPTLRNNVHTAKAYISQQDYRPAAELLGEAIEVSYIWATIKLVCFVQLLWSFDKIYNFCFQICPWDINLRELRADCYERLGMFQSAISDIK